MEKREYDILLYGATGFTGNLTSEYLAKTYKNVKIAIGGRDKSKLENIQKQMKEKFSADFDILIADSNNLEQLKDIVKKAKVVASLVGPYVRYGTNMVEACVKMGTHYVDLTGEGHWVKQIQEKFHEEATKKKVKIVNFCGFDSVPSDLSVYMMNKLVKEKYGEKEELRSVTAVYTVNQPLAGSGGTIESMFETLALPLSTLKKIFSPFYLCEKQKGGKSIKENFISYHKESQSWTHPFIMAGVNEQVVRKSNDLQDGDYSRNFEYGECMGAKSFKQGFLALVVSFLLTIFLMLSKISFLRKFLRGLLPKSTEGPSRSRMERQRCNITYFGTTSSKKPVYSSVQINGDPGYLETAKMISECAMCLVSDEEEDSFSFKGGILTPATAFGETLYNRLNKVNLGVKVYLNK